MAGATRYRILSVAMRSADNASRTGRSRVTKSGQGENPLSLKMLYVLRPEQSAQWKSVLAQSFQHDFYHLPSYHSLAEERGEGEAHLFAYTEGEYCISLPLLLRPIAAVPGLALKGEGWWDATSVYGYPGPTSSHSDVPESILRNFRTALGEAFQERKIVAVFSRLHPLIPQVGLLSGMGECTPMGQTVSIDLALPVDVQRSQYRASHRSDIGKLRRLGATCLHDQAGGYLNEFICLYNETMHRIHAADTFFSTVFILRK